MNKAQFELIVTSTWRGLSVTPAICNHVCIWCSFNWISDKTVCHDQKKHRWNESDRILSCVHVPSPFFFFFFWSSFQLIYWPVGGKRGGLPLFHWWPLVCRIMFHWCIMFLVVICQCCCLAGFICSLLYSEFFLLATQTVFLLVIIISMPLTCCPRPVCCGCDTHINYLIKMLHVILIQVVVWSCLFKRK